VIHDPGLLSVMKRGGEKARSELRCTFPSDDRRLLIPVRTGPQMNISAILYPSLRQIEKLHGLSVGQHPFRRAGSIRSLLFTIPGRYKRIG